MEKEVIIVGFLKNIFIGDLVEDTDYNRLKHELKVRKQTAVDSTF